MKNLLLVFLIPLNSFAQTWNLSLGANTTNFVFTNSAGINPTYLKPGSGLQFNVGYEKSLTKRFVYDAGLTYNQYNAVGDVQNIPFSYATDFIGLSGGIGPKVEFRNNFTLLLKARASVQKMVNGNQFLLNRYVDLAEDDQFAKARFFVGFSVELEKKVNQYCAVVAQYQHMDTNSFGASSLNFVPSTVSFGVKFQVK